MRYAFSLLELVFVVLIMGVLSALALPSLKGSKEDASLLRAKIDYEMLSSSLALMRNEASLKGFAYTSNLDNASFNLENEDLFYCAKNTTCSYSLLQSPIKSSLKGFMKITNNTYRLSLGKNKSIDFIYRPNLGVLECVNSTLCKEFNYAN